MCFHPRITHYSLSTFRTFIIANHKMKKIPCDNILPIWPNPRCNWMNCGGRSTARIRISGLLQGLTDLTCKEKITESLIHVLWYREEWKRPVLYLTWNLYYSVTTACPPSSVNTMWLSIPNIGWLKKVNRKLSLTSLHGRHWTASCLGWRIRQFMEFNCEITVLRMRKWNHFFLLPGTVPM